MLLTIIFVTFESLNHHPTPAMTTAQTAAAPFPTTDEMEAALREIGFFVGGLTDEGIAYYYAKHIIDLAYAAA